MSIKQVLSIIRPSLSRAKYAPCVVSGYITFGLEKSSNYVYWEDFSKPKILWKRVGSILRFAYNKDASLGLDSTCFATGQNIEFICCVLNSPMGHYMLKDAPKTGTGDLLISVQAVEPICIPKISNIVNDYYSKALSGLCIEENKDKETEINHRLFEIYGLSHTEIEFIEDNFS